jgi:hypothetical protein
VATGHGLAVLDVDVHGDDGGDTLAQLENKHERLTETPTVLTGSGGMHFWFLAPRETPTRPGFAPGLDLKATGGYVVVPPSLHPNGEPYRWDVGDHPTEEPLAPIPEWLLGNNKRPNPGPAPVLPKKLASGQGRNNALASLAGSMRRRGAEESAILAALRAENAAYAEPLEDAEVLRVAASVSRYPPGDGHKATLGPRVSTPSGVTLAGVHEVFRRGLHLPDPAVVDVPIAATVANLGDVDPVFLMVVGAGSRGKTEAIDAQRDIPEVHALSTLTKATLFSGYRDAKQSGKDHSLLPRLSQRGVRVLLLKDFGTVLSMHRNDRGEVLAQLREVFDGSFVKETGMGQQIAWDGHMGFIAGVTPAIDEHHAVLALLGERFVYLRIPDVDRTTASRVSLAALGKDRALREERRRVVAEFVAGLDPTQAPDLPEEVTELIVAQADFTARARTAVARDGYTREVVALPELEAPMRLAKQLASLWSGLRLIGYTEEEASAMVVRLAGDSIPPIRRVCLEYLQRAGRSKTTTLAQDLGLPSSTATRALEDLALLGVVSRDKEGTADNAPNWWEVL